MQMAHTNRVDVLERNADLVECFLDRFTRTRQHREVVDLRVETPSQRGVANQGGIEPGVQQQPPDLCVEQYSGRWLAQRDPLGRSVDRDRLRQVLPRQCQQNNPTYPSHCSYLNTPHARVLL